MASATIADLMHARGVAVAVARRDAENLAQSLAQQASDTFEVVEGSLLAMAERAQSNVSRSERERQREALAALVTSIPRLNAVFIVDGRGRLLVGSTAAGAPKLDFAHQPYFRYHETHPEQTINISGPARSDADNSQVLFVTRRLDRADGSFAGVAIAAVTLDYFETSYANVDVGRSGSIWLINRDGTLLVRRPRAFVGAKFPAAAMFTEPYKSFMAASYISASPIDGVRRLFAFRRLDRYPIVVVVALAQSEYLAAWRADALANYLALALGTALVGGLAIALGAQITRYKDVENTLALLPPFDALTGLANRRWFNSEFERELHRAARDQTPLGLLMIGVDNLKAYNDAYGREEGDDFLVSVARAIAANIVHPGNAPARYDGLNFAVILPTTNEPTALIVAERIGLAIAAISRHTGTPGADVKVNIGAVSHLPAGDHERSMLIEAAIRALHHPSPGFAT